MLTNRQVLERLSELTDEQLDRVCTVVHIMPNEECSIVAITDTTLLSELPEELEFITDYLQEDDVPLLISQ